MRSIKVLGAGLIVAFALGMASAAAANAAPTCTFPSGGSPFCETTITPGVKLSVPKGECTAGPMLITSTETFVLTAAHCFTTTETDEPQVVKNVKVQSAYPAAPTTEKVIAAKEEATVAYNKKNDVGEVKVENTEWMLAGLSPVPAAFAEWGPPAVGTVVGEAVGVEGETEICHEGLKTEEQCGEILGTKAETEVTKTGALKDDLVEVAVSGGEGDIGCPFFKFKSKPMKEVEILGIAVQAGFNRWTENGEIEKDKNKIKGLIAEITVKEKGVEKKITLADAIKDMKKKWKKGGVPVVAYGIPDGTTVKDAKLVKGSPDTTEVEMTNDAENKGKPLIVIGHEYLTWYEPMKEILKQFKGQQLLTTVKEKRG